MTCWVVYSILKGSDGGRWRWVVNFNPRPLYPWERASVPTDIRLGGPQTQSGRFWRGICLSSTWIRSPGHWACSTVTIPGLANLRHAGIFRWYATFNAVPISFIFYPTIFSILWRTCSQIQLGLVLRRFVLRWFTFTTLVESDRALPTCGASLSQHKWLFLYSVRF
jgi:hypothetical protein